MTTNSSSTTARASALPHRRTTPWPWVMIAGVLAMVTGFAAVLYPDVTALTLALIVGIGLMVSGVAQVADASKAPSGARGRGWAVAFGLLSVIAGGLCLFSPGLGVLALVFGTALWFTVAGIDDLMRSATSTHRGWNIVIGVLSLIAAVLLLDNPGAGVGTIVLIAGTLLAVRGAMVIGLAFQMRRVSHASQ